VTILFSTEAEAKNLINALRNGTAPYRHHTMILSGRDGEINTFKRALQLIENNTGLVKILVGDYGVGKSFLTGTYKHIALNDDYVIASFQINNGYRLNKLEDLYYAIMHNLYLKHDPESKSSFDAIFDLWIENLKNAPFPEQKSHEIQTVCDALSKFNHTFSRAFLSYIRSKIRGDREATSTTSAWLSGEHHIPQSLKQKVDLTGGVDKTNSLDFLKSFVKLITLLDYKGLIVFIDELDLVLHDRSDIRLNAFDNLKYLVDLTTSGELPNTFFMFTGTKEVITSTDKGVLTHTALAQRLNLNLPEDSGSVLQIDSLEPAALLELTKKVLKLYSSFTALPNNISAELLYDEINKSEPKVTRHYVTRLIERLDLEIL
jgi:hypothetical protein